MPQELLLFQSLSLKIVSLLLTLFILHTLGLPWPGGAVDKPGQGGPPQTNPKIIRESTRSDKTQKNDIWPRSCKITTKQKEVEEKKRGVIHGMK